MSAGEITPCADAGAVGVDVEAGSPVAARRSLLGCTLFPFSALLLTMLIGAGAVHGWSPGLAALLGLASLALHAGLLIRRASPLDPLIWIPVAMLLFYFATPLAIGLDGPNSTLSYDAWDLGTSQHLSEGYFAALVTLVAFLGGAHLAGVTSAIGPARPASAGRQIRIPCMIVSMGGFAMMMVGIVVVGPALLFGSYGDIWHAKAGGLDVRLLEVGFLFCQGATLGLLASHGRGNSLTLLFGVGLAGFLILYSVSTGDRAALISFGMPAAWVFSRAIRRIPWAPVLAAAFLGLLVMPVIKEFRELRRVDETRRASVGTLLVRTLYETGSTAQVFGHTLDRIPSQKGYDYGTSMVTSVLDLIPNLGMSAGKRFLPDPRAHHASTWLTYTLNPAKWAEGGGYGFAIGAEWYFNFGLPGVLLGMGLTGYLVTRLRNRALGSPLLLMSTASIYLMMLLLVRNASSAPFKVALWPLIGVLILRSVMGLVGVGAERPASGQVAPIR